MTASSPSRDNRSYYDAFSQRYEKRRHEGYHLFLDEMEAAILEPYARDRVVLEAGCGTGLILNRAAKVAKAAYGIDLSLGMLGPASERGLSVAQSSVVELPFAGESFDTVYSFKVLAHVEDARGAIEEMARVVRPGGHLVLEYYNRASLRYLVKRLKPAQEVADNTTDEHVYTRYDTLSELSALLPLDISLVDVAGIRVVTPIAGFFNLPAVGRAVEVAERAASRSPLRRLGGFLILILRKRG